MKPQFGLVFEIGYVIAIPAVALTFGGHWLDGVLGTEPWLTLGGLLLSLPLAALAVWHKVQPYLQESDRDADGVEPR